VATIEIQTLMPSSGSVPSNGYDPLSLAGFTEWRIGDEARFSVVLPETYRPGNDAHLRIEESSASASRRHTWQAVTVLMRPGVHDTDAPAAVETFTIECQSSSDPDRLTTRTFSVTGSAEPGRIAGVALMPGDLLCVALTRVNAASQEDSAAIRLFDLAFSMRVDETAASDCAGRVGIIFDTVRDLFNETNAGFLPDDFIVRCINRCQQDLAQEDYWRRETWIPAMSGVDRIDLLSGVSGYQNLHQVSFSGQTTPMSCLGSFREYEELRRESAAAGTPQAYVVQNDTLSVWPKPSESAASGFCLYHSYVPDDLTCSPDNPNPAIPRAHDMLFVYFVLKQAFLRDRHAPGADVKFQEYSHLYEQEKQHLLGEGEPPRVSVRPYR
jgi:hypothetical protein